MHSTYTDKAMTPKKKELEAFTDEEMALLKEKQMLYVRTFTDDAGSEWATRIQAHEGGQCCVVSAACGMLPPV